MRNEVRDCEGYIRFISHHFVIYRAGAVRRETLAGILRFRIQVRARSASGQTPRIDPAIRRRKLRPLALLRRGQHVRIDRIDHLADGEVVSINHFQQRRRIRAIARLAILGRAPICRGKTNQRALRDIRRAGKVL